MYLFNGSLLVNGVQSYDSAGKNTHTTVSVEDASNFSGNVHGFHKLDSVAHAAGWVSEISDEWKGKLGGDLIFGYASNVSIISRLRVGPTAFVVDSLTEFTNINGATSEQISNTALLDFDLDNFLYDEEVYGADPHWGSVVGINSDGRDNLWNYLSRAYYGFFIPGTRTYMTVGNSGGHESGVGYKIYKVMAICAVVIVLMMQANTAIITGCGT